MVAVSDPTITAPPQIHPGHLLVRQGAILPNIAYLSTNSSYVQTKFCLDSGSLHVSNSFAACCYPGYQCNFATTCLGSKAEYPPSVSTFDACDGKDICNTDFIYGTPGEASPTLWIGCASWNNRNMFLAIPSTAIASSTLTAAAATTSTAAATTSASSSSSSTSQAWIAGAVIGPIAIICLTAAFIYFHRNRRRQRALAAGHDPRDPHGHPGYPTSYSQHVDYPTASPMYGPNGGYDNNGMLIIPPAGTELGGDQKGFYAPVALTGGGEGLSVKSPVETEGATISELGEGTRIEPKEIDGTPVTTPVGSPDDERGHSQGGVVYDCISAVDEKGRTRGVSVVRDQPTEAIKEEGLEGSTLGPDSRGPVYDCLSAVDEKGRTSGVTAIMNR